MGKALRRHAASALTERKRQPAERPTVHYVRTR
jgi:hypothetical protein